MNRTKQIAPKETAIQLPYGADLLTMAIRHRVRESITTILEEELSFALGVQTHERSSARRGYRHGSQPRALTTSLGPTVFNKPRAKLFVANGQTVEWQSALLPRYARRAKEVDAALLGIYFGGVNTRKIKQALRPLLREACLSKSSVSRLIVRLKEHFEGWRRRSLADEDIRYLYLDGIYLRVRCGGRVSRLPILVVIGVRATGEKVLVALDVRGGESEEAWKGVLEGLVSRGLGRPQLCVIDGGMGLSKALDAVWPQVRRQRCAVHKLRNILAHAPEHLHEEIRTDFHAIVYADSEALARTAHAGFLRKWRKLSEGVARSLEEAGADLLTFFRFPRSQWRSLRTTNAVERLNEEFRRRVKSQSSFPTESSVLVLLYGLVASGMIRLRRLEGYEDMVAVRIVDPRASSCVGVLPALEECRDSCLVAPLP